MLLFWFLRFMTWRNPVVTSSIIGILCAFILNLGKLTNLSNTYWDRLISIIVVLNEKKFKTYNSRLVKILSLQNWISPSLVIMSSFQLMDNILREVNEPMWLNSIGTYNHSQKCALETFYMFGPTGNLCIWYYFSYDK